MALEEPTVGEMIRSMSASVLRIEAALVTFVTQDQRTFDKELAATRMAELERDVASLTEDKRATRRLVWSAGLFPAIVGLVLYLIQGVIK